MSEENAVEILLDLEGLFTGACLITIEVLGLSIVTRFLLERSRHKSFSRWAD